MCIILLRSDVISGKNKTKNAVFRILFSLTANASVYNYYQNVEYFVFILTLFINYIILQVLLNTFLKTIGGILWL